MELKLENLKNKCINVLKGIKDKLKGMFDKGVFSVIAFDENYENIAFCSVNEKGDLVFDTVKISAKPLSGEFFERVKNILSIRNENAQEETRTTIILPDSVFFTDTITIPYVKGALESSLNLAIDTLYQNRQELKVRYSLVSQNKKTANFAIVGARRDVLARFKQAVEGAGTTVANITFWSNAAVSGAMSENSKLRGATFLLLDVREDYSVYSFVVNGKTMSYYTLPFGQDVLKEDEVMMESALFDHAEADLLVLNAREKAKKKDLTTLTSLGEDDLDDDFDGDDDDDKGDVAHKLRTMVKRNTRLPKFMLRPIPETPDDTVYENFRIFMKWAGELIRNNLKLVGDDTVVYVNMPEKYNFIFDKIKADEECKTQYSALLPEYDQDVSSNLALIGGLYVRRYSRTNNW